MHKKHDKPHIYLTGFGKFGSVLENPTTFLVQEYRKMILEQNRFDWDISCHVLETSTVGSLKQLQPFWQSESDSPSSKCIFLHLGVDITSRCFKIESTAYNCANFRIPDERGYVAQNECILENMSEKLYSKIDISLLKDELTMSTQHKVTISDDPGRYICNYVYFQSLARFSNSSKQHALFVHVPPFEVICFEDQFKFLQTLIGKLITMI